MFAANKFSLIAFLSVALLLAPVSRAQQTYAVPPYPALSAAAASHPMAAYNQWLATNMTPWLSILNPYFYSSWPNAMINPWVDQITQHATMDAMMRSMDPRLMGAMPMAGILGFPTQSERPRRPNTVTEGVSLDAKRNFYQSMMAMNPAMGMMYPAMGMMTPAMMMNPMGMMAGPPMSPTQPPAGGAQLPPGQDVNPYQQWLDAWQQMMNQRDAATAQ